MLRSSTGGLLWSSTLEGHGTKVSVSITVGFVVIPLVGLRNKCPFTVHINCPAYLAGNGRYSTSQKGKVPYPHLAQASEFRYSCALSHQVAQIEEELYAGLLLRLLLLLAAATGAGAAAADWLHPVPFVGANKLQHKAVLLRYCLQTLLDAALKAIEQR